MNKHRQPGLAALIASLLITTAALGGCGQPATPAGPAATVTVTATAPPSGTPGTAEPLPGEPSGEQTTGPTEAVPSEEPAPEEPAPEPEPAPEEPAPDEPGELDPTPTPTITGTAVYRQTLVAHTGTWGPGDVTLKYRWFRSGAAISGATDPAYVLVLADIGHRIKVRVTGSKEGYTSVARYSSATAEIEPASLTSTPTPTLSGTAQVGRTLTADPGDWGPGTVHLTYRWYRSGAVISGADDPDYDVVAADLGETIKVRVSGSKSGYQTIRKHSAETTPVIAGVLTTSAPSITGTAQVGRRLYAHAGEWGPDPIHLTYRWYRTATQIPGATGSSYLVRTGDLDKRIRVVVRGTKPGFTTAARSSALTDPVQPGVFTSTPLPTLPGTLRVGQLLNGRVTWQPIPVTITYQWFRNGVPIAGATSPEYRVQLADLGDSIRVRVQGTKPGYATQFRVTPPSPAVQPGLLRTSVPTISGTPMLGMILHANPGLWGPVPINFTYQWRRDGAPIVGATSANRTVTLGDRGHRLSVTVRGTKPGYLPVSRTSAQTPLVP